LFNDNATLLQDNATTLADYLKRQLQSNLVESIKKYTEGVKRREVSDDEPEQSLEPDISDIIDDDDYEILLNSRVNAERD
jgi:hypothetical protein